MEDEHQRLCKVIMPEIRAEPHGQADDDFDDEVEMPCCSQTLNILSSSAFCGHVQLREMFFKKLASRFVSAQSAMVTIPDSGAGMFCTTLLPLIDALLNPSKAKTD